jgi:hypothetical protein
MSAKSRQTISSGWILASPIGLAIPKAELLCRIFERRRWATTDASLGSPKGAGNAVSAVGYWGMTGLRPGRRWPFRPWGKRGERGIVPKQPLRVAAPGSGSAKLTQTLQALRPSCAKGRETNLEEPFPLFVATGLQPRSKDLRNQVPMKPRKVPDCLRAH